VATLIPDDGDLVLALSALERLGGLLSEPSASR